jgi:proteasome accessory factor C
MLSLVPWVAARGSAPIDEVCQRFAIDREQLLRDLDTVSMVGLYPYTPDVLVELYVDAGEVHITLPQAFDRPLRLTSEQAVALVAAGSALLAVPGADADGPLARGLAKLSAALGGGAEPGVEVRLTPVPGDVLDSLRTAVAEHRQVRIRYYAYGRDEHTERVIDPYRVASDEGQWYVGAYCHLAEGDRLFRIDRISSAELLESGFDAPSDPPDEAVFNPNRDDPRVVIELAADAAWVTEQYPVEAVEELGADGCRRATLAVTARPWFERLMLRLGPSARVVDGPDDLRAATSAAARRVLARYDRDVGRREPENDAPEKWDPEN